MDVPDEARRVHVAHVHGNYRTTGVLPVFEEARGRPALELPNLRVQPGEKIAVLGRMGAGKSTLLQLFAGMYKPKMQEASAWMVSTWP